MLRASLPRSTYRGDAWSEADWGHCRDRRYCRLVHEEVSHCRAYVKCNLRTVQSAQPLPALQFQELQMLADGSGVGGLGRQSQVCAQRADRILRPALYYQTHTEDVVRRWH